MTEATTPEALLAAVEASDAKRVKALLKAGVNPVAQADDTTPFHQACFQGERAMVTAMLKVGADPNLRGPRGHVPLALAASRDHVSVVRRLLDAGADVHARDADQGTALHIAAAEGASKALGALVDAGAEVAAVDTFDATPAIYAAMHGRKKAVAALKKAGADLGRPDRFGRTPLHHAIACAHKRRVSGWRSEGVLDGKDVAYEIRRGVMRFHPDLRERRWTILDTKNQRVIAGKFCQPHLAYLDAYETAVTIMRSGVDTAARDVEGVSPVFLAAEMGDERLLHETLKKAGDDPNAILPTASGQTLAHAIARAAHAPFMRALKPKTTQAIVWDATDAAGRTALHVVAEHGDYEAVSWISAQDLAGLFREDTEGLTALDVAAASGNLEVAKKLYEQMSFSALMKGKPAPQVPAALASVVASGDATTEAAPAPMTPPSEVAPASPPRSTEELALAEQVEALSPADLAIAMRGFKGTRRWTWGDPATTEHGVELYGASLIWFSQSGSPHGTNAQATQPMASFLRDGQSHGDKASAEVLAEVLEAIRALVASASG